MITEKNVYYFLVCKNDKIQHHNSSLTDLQYSPSSTQIRWARMGEFFSSANRSSKCSSISSTIPSHCKIKIWIRKKNVKKFVKLCLHSNYTMQNSQHFDVIFFIILKISKKKYLCTIFKFIWILAPKMKEQLSWFLAWKFK